MFPRHVSVGRLVFNSLSHSFLRVPSTCMTGKGLTGSDERDKGLTGKGGIWWAGRGSDKETMARALIPKSLLAYKLVNFLTGRKLRASRTNPVRHYTVTEGPTEDLHLRFGAGWAMTLTTTVLSGIVKGKHVKQLLSLSSLTAVHKQNRTFLEKTFKICVLSTEISKNHFL